MSYQTNNYDDFFEPQNLPNEVVAEYREQQGRFNYDGESDNDGKREKRDETQLENEAIYKGEWLKGTTV